MSLFDVSGEKKKNNFGFPAYATEWVSKSTTFLIGICSFVAFKKSSSCVSVIICELMHTTNESSEDRPATKIKSG